MHSKMKSEENLTQRRPNVELLTLYNSCTVRDFQRKQKEQARIASIKVKDVSRPQIKMHPATNIRP